MSDVEIEQENEPRHTEEMQDIIGAPPAWLLRWGITLFFLVLVLILSISEVIKYPDIVKTQLAIRSINMPQPIVAKTPGKLIALLVQNTQQVNANQPLVIIQSDTGKITILSPRSGRLTYVGILHEGQQLLPNQVMFHISSDDEAFFGEMPISQTNIGKVKAGMEVIVKLKSYPYEEYGMIHGTIKYIADNPVRSGDFLAEVDLKTKNITDMHKSLDLKQGMMADADIITANSSLFKRLTGTVFKNINH